MRDWRRKDRRREVRRFASAISRCDAAADWSRIRHLVIAMLQKFGGIDGFSKIWMTEIERARQAVHGRTLGLRSCLAILTLQIAVEQHQPASIESDEVIEQRIRNGLAELIKANPALAVEAAEQLGWEVIPPNQEERCPAPIATPSELSP
jgi:hypothetical protein